MIYSFKYRLTAGGDNFYVGSADLVSQSSCRLRDPFLLATLFPRGEHLVPLIVWLLDPSFLIRTSSLIPASVERSHRNDVLLTVEMAH